jgi:serine/threonine protein kinase
MNAQKFVHHLQRSGLLSLEQIEGISKRLTEQEVSKVVVDLVEEGLLTRFQTKQLLAGNSRGFLFGPYRIVDQLGHGGMGIVYKAMHTGMRRLVAVKVLLPTMSSNKKWHRHIFEREAMASAQLDHPNIVTIYDAGKRNGVHYLAMEFIRGPNLKKLVQENGRLPMWLACELTRQAADALQYAHERGFVHRDVKPSNMLLAAAPGLEMGSSNTTTAPPFQAGQSAYRIKVLDFGLARLRCQHPFLKKEDGTLQARSGTVWGTLDYISPEQIMNVHAVDIRADLYSLGCSLYFLLTGQVPFGTGTVTERLIKRVTDEPQPVDQLRRNTPAGLAKIVRRLMNPVRSKRFATPSELMAELVPWCKPSGWEEPDPTEHTRENLVSDPSAETDCRLKSRTDTDIDVRRPDDSLF